MKRTVTIASALALAAAVPAWAAKPPHPTHPAHPTHPSHPSQAAGPNNSSCSAKTEGYRATGTLSSASLTPGTGKDRYDGTLTIDVLKANHHAATGSQTFTLSNARVRFGKGVDPASPASGDRVTLHGKITVLPHGCSTAGFSQTITLGGATVKLPHNRAH